MDDRNLLPPTPDDRIWSLFDRFLAGECSAGEAAGMRAWIAADSANARELELVRRAREIGAKRPPTRSAEAAWKEAAAQLGISPPARPERVLSTRFGSLTEETRPRRWTLALGLAAALVLAAGVALKWPAAPPPAPTPPPRTHTTYTTLRGQRLQFRLSDGTSVLLAPGSELRVPADYGEQQRRLELAGEAFFVVTHDSTRPFSVAASTLIAHDLGTRFGLRAYADEPTAEMVVAEGKVEVMVPPTAGGSGRGAISPVAAVYGANEVARVDAHGTLTRAVADPAQLLSWTEGRLVFRDMPLDRVIAQLSRWYDVDIQLGRPELGVRLVTASLKDEPASEALRLIAVSLDLGLVRRDGVYRLSPKSR